MEILLILILLGIGAWWFFMREQLTKDTNSAPLEQKVEEVKKVLDVNQDNKVDIDDVKEVVKKTRTRVKKVADLDNDGKVTLNDAKVAVKKVATKAKTQTKSVGRKPKLTR